MSKKSTANYGTEQVEVPKKTTAKGSLDWPTGWKPLTPGTYSKLVAWRRDRSRQQGKINYTPKLETFLRFDVREKAGASHPLIGFPYKLHGRLENLKVLEITAAPVIADGRTVDYKALTAVNEKTGKTEVIRKMWQDDATPKNPGVLFGFDLLLPDDPAARKFSVKDSPEKYYIENPDAGAVLFPDIVICEGEFDAMCLHECGRVALSILNAGASKEIHPAIIEMLRQTNVYLLTDSDKSGDKCAKRLLPALPPQTVRARLEGAKDACELYAKVGHKEAVRVLDGLLRLPPAPAPAELASMKAEDMPEDVLDGWLGEVCRKRMASFPIALAWPALVTVAGTLVTECKGIRTNLYLSHVGPVGCGKTQSAEWALKLLGFDPKKKDGTLVTDKLGSAEGLARQIGDVGSEPRLWFPGELAHTLGKAMIENASFPTILCDAFYQNDNSIRIEKQKEIPFVCRLSIMGGIVRDRFSTVFGAESLGGVYDRFTFALCPDGFMWEYRDFEGAAEVLPDLKPIEIDPEVWKEKQRWYDAEGIGMRAGEQAIRVAAICAAFDGKSTLRLEDLAPALVFARYQQRARMFLQPNAGETNEGRITEDFLSYLKRHAPAGQWINRRDMYRATNVYKIGVSIADRVLKALEFNREIESRDMGNREKQLRLVH